MTEDSFAEESLQQLLEEVARDNGFEEPKFELASATKPGDNYIGRVVRVVVTEGGPEEKEPLPLIFKIAPTSEARRNILNSGSIFLNEASMYQKVLPKFNELLKEHGLSETDTYPGSARCFRAELNEDSTDNGVDVLVLEDMKAKGFVMLERQVGLSAEALGTILRHLARIHATSLALRALRPEEAAEIESSIREVIFDDGKNFLRDMLPAAERSLTFFDDHYPEGTPEYEKVKDLVGQYAHELQSLVQPNGTVNCVTHGDCWINNVLFKFDEDGKVEDICLIDYQVSRVASPVLDIAYLFFTCTTKEIRDEHYDSLLHEYHDEATHILTSVGCDAEELYSWDMFQDQLKAYGRFGLLMALVATPLFLADSSPEDGDNQMENNASKTTVFGPVLSKDDEVRQRLSDVLSDCIQLGYL